jgi:hypothetical protein
MPSPSGQLLKVVIRDSSWLTPDISHTLILPDAILPGGQVTIPGQLRAQICHETTPRESGSPLSELDTVSLLCYSERLRRAVPELSGGYEFKVEYPLRLGRPTCMDCMTRNDEMAVYWTVSFKKVFFWLVLIQDRWRTYRPKHSEIRVPANAVPEPS